MANKGLVQTDEAKNQNLNATLSVDVPFQNVHVLPQTPQLIALLSSVLNQPDHHRWSHAWSSFANLFTA